jgi:hypothetical protein
LALLPARQRPDCVTQGACVALAYWTLLSALLHWQLQGRGWPKKEKPAAAAKKAEPEESDGEEEEAEEAPPAKRVRPLGACWSASGSV